MNRTIIHSDMNNFYASVECLYNPAIRNKPVAVVGDVEKRHGIVLAKNYIAKGFGIKTGNAVWEAKKLCPELVLVPPSYDKYLRFSKMTKEIYSEYTDCVESFGLDECWLDVSESTGLFGDGGQIADTIRERVKSELGLTVSVGVSWNKIFAKLGSDMKKPDVTTIITQDNYKGKVWPLAAEELLYVGRATKRKLRSVGILTIGDLAKADPKVLKSELGVNGIMLWRFANGLDDTAVSKLNDEFPIKSIGNSTTLPYDVTKENDIKITLYVLSESVAERLRDHNFLCRTVQIGIRDKNLYSYERQGKLSFETNSAGEIYKTAFALYNRNKPAYPIRGLSVRAADLSGASVRQLSCLEEFERMEKQERAEAAVDDIRRRFGHFSIQRGIMLTNTELSALDPKGEHVIHPVGFLK
ncbi:MAG: DNA polymerase IV [Clostridiales bacterium]|nr:DNA polymerase IV [Clostridiales bacterium]